MSLNNIAIIGANGLLGPYILDALLSHPTLKVTVLSRQSSKSTYSNKVKVESLPNDLPHSSLVSALKNQDALILSFSGSETDTSKKLIAAAVEANVKRIIPADFGSCDSSDPRTLRLIPLYPEKKKVRDHLVQLVDATGGKLGWTSIVCGHFLDHGLTTALLQFDVKGKKARIFDGGDVRFSSSVLRTVGAAVVGILKHPEETKNKLIFVQSVSTTQNELLEVVEKVRGVKFEIESRDSDQFISERQDNLKENPKDGDVIEDLVGVEGIVNGDWTKKKNFMNELLELPDEDLEKIVRDAIGDL